MTRTELAGCLGLSFLCFPNSFSTLAFWVMFSFNTQLKCLTAVMEPNAMCFTKFHFLFFFFLGTQRTTFPSLPCREGGAVGRSGVSHLHPWSLKPYNSTVFSFSFAVMVEATCSRWCSYKMEEIHEYRGPTRMHCSTPFYIKNSSVHSCLLLVGL